MKIVKATLSDVDTILALIQERISWMDKKSLYQWNQTEYLDIYPRPYWEKRISEGSLFIAVEGKEILGAIALLEQDDRWNDPQQAIYIHHLVTRPDFSGIGKQLLDFAEKYAERQHICFLRLDSQKGNDSLSRYYKSLGYFQVGQCCDGLYTGIKWEKSLF